MALLTISATTAERLAYMESIPRATEQGFWFKRTCPCVVSSTLQPNDVFYPFFLGIV